MRHLKTVAQAMTIVLLTITQARADGTIGSALLESDLVQIRSLIMKDPNLTESDIGGVPILIFAASASSPAAIQALAELGADIEAVDASGKTALVRALESGRVENAKALVALGATNSFDEDFALARHLGVNTGLSNLEQQEIQPGFDKEASQSEIDALLLHAASSGNAAAVKLALSEGAQMTATSSSGHTAPILAALTGSLDVIDVLARQDTFQASIMQTSGDLDVVSATLMSIPHIGQDKALWILRRVEQESDQIFTQNTTRHLEAYDLAIIGEANMDPRIRRMIDRATSEQVVAQPPGSDTPDANFPDIDQVTEVEPLSLVKSLQTALNAHNCNAGIVDGSFGTSSARAIELFNRMKPAACKDLESLERIGRRTPDPAFIETATSNLNILRSCEPNPICGKAAPAEYVRDFKSFCLVYVSASSKLEPGEYSEWSGSCDENGFATGQGTLQYFYPIRLPPNSSYDQYKGEMRKGKAYGQGVLTRKNGTTYSGQFMNDKRHGWGRNVYATGRIWHGNWIKGRANGKGIFTWEDGDFWEGRMKNNKLHGWGYLTYRHACGRNRPARVKTLWQDNILVEKELHICNP